MVLSSLHRIKTRDEETEQGGTYQSLPILSDPKQTLIEMSANYISREKSNSDKEHHHSRQMKERKHKSRSSSFSSSQKKRIKEDLMSDLAYAHFIMQKLDKIQAEVRAKVARREMRKQMKEKVAKARLATVEELKKKFLQDEQESIIAQREKKLVAIQSIAEEGKKMYVKALKRKFLVKELRESRKKARDEIFERLMAERKTRYCFKNQNLSKRHRHNQRKKMCDLPSTFR